MMYGEFIEEYKVKGAVCFIGRVKCSLNEDPVWEDSDVYTLAVITEHTENYRLIYFEAQSLYKPHVAGNVKGSGWNDLYATEKTYIEAIPVGRVIGNVPECFVNFIEDRRKFYDDMFQERM